MGLYGSIVIFGFLLKVLESLFALSIPFILIIWRHYQDWEDGLCESDADGSFLHENWNSDLRLFSGGEDGGHQLLQVFLYWYHGFKVS